MSDQHHPEWPTADDDAQDATHPDTRSQPKTATEQNKTDTDDRRSDRETVTHPTPDPSAPEPTDVDTPEATAGDTAKLVLGEPTESPDGTDEPEAEPAEVVLGEPTPEAEDTPEEPDAAQTDQSAQSAQPAQSAAEPSAEDTEDLEPTTEDEPTASENSAAGETAKLESVDPAGPTDESAPDDGASTSPGSEDGASTGRGSEDVGGADEPWVSGERAPEESTGGDTAKLESVAPVEPAHQPASDDGSTSDGPVASTSPSPGEAAGPEKSADQPPTDEPPQPPGDNARTTELPTPDVSAEQPGAGDTAKLVLGETTEPIDEPAPDEPAPDEPARDESSRGEPSRDEPARDEPARGEPAPDEPESSDRTAFVKPVDQEPGWLFTPQTPAKRDPRDAEPPGWLFIPQDPPEAETPAALAWPEAKPAADPPKSDPPPTQSTPPVPPPPPVQSPPPPTQPPPPPPTQSSVQSPAPPVQSPAPPVQSPAPPVQSPVPPTQPAVPPTQPAVPPTQPARPTQPAQPSRPAQPTQPAQPSQPTQPAQPGQPSRPAQPGQPTQPAQPSQPAKSSRPAQPTQPLESPSWPAGGVPTEVGRVGWPTSPTGEAPTVETPSWPATRIPTEPPTVSGLAPVQPPARPKAPDVDKDRTVVARPVAPPQVPPKPQKPQNPQNPPQPPRQDSTAERTVVTRPVPPPEPKRPSYTEPATKRIQVPEPPRAAPVRIEPAQPKAKPDLPEEEPKASDEPRRSRKKLALVGGAVVLVLALVGGALAVPGIRAKLGLGGGEPDVAIQPPPAPVAFTPSLKGPNASAPTPTAQGVHNALAGPASVPALGTFNGIVIDPATGQTLWEQRATTPVTPASTAKILTSAAALLTMDRGTQFATKVVAGKDPGSVVLVGGGDPTVSSLPAGKNSVYHGAAHLDDLVAQVKATGKVTTVYYDASRYTGDGLTQGWLPGDVQGGYIAPIGPMMLDGGRQNPAEVDTPRTSTPARTMAAELAKRLGATLAAKPEATAAPDAKVLGEIKSAPLAELIDNALQISDNVLAETVARELAKAAGEEPSFAGVTRTTLKILQANGFDTTGVKLVDGSGLSTVDLATPKLLADILAVAAAPDGGKDPRTAKLRPILGGLPVAGGSGTLEGRFGSGAPGAGGRGWVRAKTGTLSGVNSLAGLVLDADGRVLVFAMTTNGPDTNAARPALDAVAAALRGCGCK